VLGGGGFLGYHAVAEALAAGHEVTVLSRSGKAPVEGVEVLVGDRTGDLSALRGRTWDGVLDTFNDTRDGAPDEGHRRDALNDMRARAPTRISRRRPAWPPDLQVDLSLDGTHLLSRRLGAAQ
jgi:nucleoside-diphosphate-sugar epimerase